MENCAKFEDLILRLHEVEGVKFGEFKLKSGLLAPVYFDLRVIVSYPDLMRMVSQYLWDAAKNVDAKFASICGVPYTALPIATVMSVDNKVPMLIRRREAKDYGTKKMIEGHYNPGDVCLVVEDVVTSGSSVYETVQLLAEYKLQVRDAVVLLDRQQGGSEILAQKRIRLHSVLTMTDVMTTLLKHGRVDQTMYNSVLKFITENRLDVKKPSDSEDVPAKKAKSEMTFGERAAHCKHPLSKNLLQLMERKKTNLVVSVDFTSSEKILKLVEQVGDKVCMVKTHVDIIEDFSPEFTRQLRDLADRLDFLIFEDRKFADIGNTVKNQYGSGIYKIADWAHIVNAHSVSGPGVVKGLQEVGEKKGRGCLLIGEMSSSGSLASGTYTAETVKMAETNSDFVIGFICQHRLSEDPQFIHMTPGVKLSSGTDSLGQQYTTPRDAILTNKCDLIIVGRGIYTSDEPAKEAELYREAAYNAYQERTGASA